tara:strand:+ start:260 stop:505 length:246 start_codon:yes stop_codon:yes gene_type:complete
MTKPVTARPRQKKTRSYEYTSSTATRAPRAGARPLTDDTSLSESFVRFLLVPFLLSPPRGGPDRCDKEKTIPAWNDKTNEN